MKVSQMPRAEPQAERESRMTVVERFLNVDLAELAEERREAIARHNAFKAEIAQVMKLSPMEEARYRAVRADQGEYAAGKFKQEVQTKRLRQFFFADGRNRERQWQNSELSEIFNRFRLLGSAEDQISLVQAVQQARHPENSRFLQAPRIREFYAVALAQQGNYREARRILQGLVNMEQGNALVFGTLGKVYEERAELARQALQNPHDVVLLDRYRTQVDRNLQDRVVTDDPAKLEIILAELAAQDEKDALIVYEQAFLEPGGSALSTIGWYRMLAKRRAHLSREAGTLGTEGDEGAAKQAELLQRQEVLMRELLRLTRYAARIEGGLESRDYSVGACLLEATCSEAGRTKEDLLPILQRMFENTDAIHTLENTQRNLKHLRSSYEALGKPLELFDFALQQIEAAKFLFRSSGRAVDAENRLFQASATPEHQFLQSTYTYRGLVAGITPAYLPGILPFEGRVADTIFGRADARQLTKVLQEREIDAMPPEEALWAITALVRERFSVPMLQDLQSEDHKRFDKTSDAALKLMGIESRKGSQPEIVTSISGALALGIGDCREVVQAVTALFTIYQQLRFKEQQVTALEHLKEVLSAPEPESAKAAEQAYAEAMKHLAEITHLQLRVGERFMYASIDMEGNYKPKRGAKGEPVPAERRYGLAEVRAGEKLTEYELKNSFVRITYRNAGGGITVKTLGPPKFGEQLPHANGVLTIPELDQAEQIEVFHLIEEHTKNFLVVTDDSGRIVRLEHADAFYASNYDAIEEQNLERRSPYNSNQEPYRLIDLGQLAEHDSIPSGTRQTETGEVPVRERAAFYSVRREEPALSRLDEAVTFFNSQLADIDLSEELENIDLLPAVHQRFREWLDEQSAASSLA